MTDESLADPAELTQDASGDTTLSDSSTLEASGETGTAVYCSPVLDRIRTSD